MTLKGEEDFYLKGIMQGSPNEKERYQEMLEMPGLFNRSFKSSNHSR